MYQGIRKALTIAAAALGVWIAVRYFLPLSLPFLLGFCVALVAEPMAGFLSARLRLRRGAASGIAVTAAFCLLALLALLLCALILRELAALVRVLPDLESTISGGLSALSGWAMELASRMPEPVRTQLGQTIQDFFSGSSELIRQAFRFALGFTGGVLSAVPGSALVLGTAIVSSYMISIRLPRIKAWLSEKLSQERLRKFWSGFSRLKGALFGWLKAQAKLMGMTFLILTMGLVLLRVPYAPLWAGGVALVDAFPILGTGTVLLPWSLISFLQGDTVRGIGLLSVYALISLTRSVMEPKLLGEHLGLDPLATLAALYAGYQLWGFGGMLAAPVLAVAAAQLLREPKT